MSFDSEYWSDPDKWKEHTKPSKAIDRPMLDVSTKAKRDALLNRASNLGPSGFEEALCNYIDALERRVERMQAVVEAARAYQFDPYNEPNAIALDNALAALDASKDQELERRKSNA